MKQNKYNIFTYLDNSKKNTKTPQKTPTQPNNFIHAKK